MTVQIDDRLGKMTSLMDSEFVRTPDLKHETVCDIVTDKFEGLADTFELILKSEAKNFEKIQNILYQMSHPREATSKFTLDDLYGDLS